MLKSPNQKIHRASCVDGFVHLETFRQVDADGGIRVIRVPGVVGHRVGLVGGVTHEFVPALRYLLCPAVPS